jgi:DNA-binding MarR family transcriptional regulator
MSSTPGGQDIAGPSTEQIDAVVLATRVLVAVTAQSIVSVEDRVSLPQFRVLVMIASRGRQNLRSVARGLGVHASNVTRLCDKLVEAGLLQRSDDPADRRNLVLGLTAAGDQLVKDVTNQRRAAIASVLPRCPLSCATTWCPCCEVSPRPQARSPKIRSGRWGGAPNTRLVCAAATRVGPAKDRTALARWLHEGRQRLRSSRTV